MNSIVSVRLSHEPQARLRWHAAAAGCTISDYIRGLITEHLNAHHNGTGGTPEPVALPEPFDDLLRALGYDLNAATAPTTGRAPTS